ncbi:MAG: hypothetical protein ACT4PP_06230 [Sporichthyaceae bacterium]
MNASGPTWLFPAIVVLAVLAMIVILATTNLRKRERPRKGVPGPKAPHDPRGGPDVDGNAVTPAHHERSGETSGG